jgi:curved DNA-binding protein CbpA
VAQNFKDYYNILSIPFSATEAEIKLAYRKMARLFHPDMHPEDPEGFTAKFQEITEAYETLSDAYKKQGYDQRYRQYVLMEQTEEYYYEPETHHYYYEPQQQQYYYQEYQKPVESKRKSYVPYGALVMLVIFFLRLLSNSSPTEEASFKYNPATPLPVEIQHIIDSTRKTGDTTSYKIINPEEGKTVKTF